MDLSTRHNIIELYVYECKYLGNVLFLSVL